MYTDEELDDLAKQCDAAVSLDSLDFHHMPDLINEVRRLREEARVANQAGCKYAEMWWTEHKALHKVLCEGSFSLDRDPMALMPVFCALQDCENGISTGKARECVRRWLAGLPLGLDDVD